MRKMFLMSMIGISSLMYSQFNLGYERGHQDGYCNAATQDGAMYCNYPYTYVSVPLPKVGESYNSYRDGYSRGVYDGQNAYYRRNSSNNRSSGSYPPPPTKYRDPSPLRLPY